MAEVYKTIHPQKFFNDYISRDIRPDGRKFCDQRNVKINVNAIKTADSSAVAKCGNTTVVCGIKLELACPKAEDPNSGFLVTNVELPPLCSSKFRPGPPSDHAQVISTIVSDIMINSKCINLEELCIIPDKLAWVLYCDIICLDNDGSVVDSCLMTLLASLKTLALPAVSYDAETEVIEVDVTKKTPLTIHGFPVATSFTIYNLKTDIILADPTAYEEEMCGGNGANIIICYNKGQLSGVEKFGGSNLTTEMQDKAMKISLKRAKLVEDVIEECVKNT